MTNTENRHSQDYFVRSHSIWFPDFEEMLESKEAHYRKLGDGFSSLMMLLRFFRRELTRGQFAALFPEQKAPEKMVLRQRRVYNCAHEMCTAYQRGAVSDEEFDGQLLLSFRNRPAEDVFAPAPEAWEEITRLIFRLERKSERLPVWFDGLAWNGYLKGNVTSRQFAQATLSGDTAGYLAQLMAYGTDCVKKELTQIYGDEVSVCLQLKELCFEYQNGRLSRNDFDARFLQLAEAFCRDEAE